MSEINDGYGYEKSLTKSKDYLNLREAKRVLYVNLLNIPSEKLSKGEIEIMFQLSMDKQIQEILE